MSATLALGGAASWTLATALPWPSLRWPWSRPAELRIDVDRPSDSFDNTLDELHQRLYTPGDPLHGIDSQPLPDARFRLRVREADGEYFTYVEDMQHQCLAGATVFNRLVEVNRRADRHLRSPHSRYRPQYQRCGLATAVYDWVLGQGICLMTGARQSVGAHGLWRSLARRYPAGFVALRDKQLRYLGPDIGAEDMQRLETRMVLLGVGWTWGRFAQETGMEAVIAS